MRRTVMIIKASASLRNNYSEISKLAKETNEPIFITKNGEGDLVLLSMEAFEKMEQIFRLRENLSIAEKQRINGDKTFSIEEAKEILMAKDND